MKIDIVSIFPEYLDVLNLSLIGKARQKRLLTVNVHDLRDYSDDGRRTVDDTPYGGGAGMVMKVEPWINALEHLHGSKGTQEENACKAQRKERAVLVLPSPAGQLFDQSAAQELATRGHIIFACGRYEGIDQRVEELAEQMFEVRPLSIGDYVLNGGEAAVLVMVEAIARLVPGVIGNERSLEEESHGHNGLLEYPVYTKPSQWRGAAVPEVLLSGNHQEIFSWRFEQRLNRTKRYRPELFENLDLKSFSPWQRVLYDRVKKDRPAAKNKETV